MPANTLSSSLRIRSVNRLIRNGMTIYNVPSIRRNPVIADMFTQLDYMEKRGSGLRKMRELTEKLPNFLPGKEPRYKTEASSFFTTFYNLNWDENGRIPVEEVADRVNSTLKKCPVNEECSVKTFGETKTVRTNGSKHSRPCNIRRFHIPRQDGRKDWGQQTCHRNANCKSKSQRITCQRRS